MFKQSLPLSRYPITKKGDLRAWDAADEYILDQVLATHQQTPLSQVWVFEDSYGAIRFNLEDAGICVTSINDNVLHQIGMINNASALGRNLDIKTLLTPFDCLSAPPTPDLIVLKIGKNLAYLSHLFALIHQHASHTPVVAGSMVKHTPSTIYRQFSEQLGPTTTSLAQKKARLAFCTPDGALCFDAEPTSYATNDDIPVVSWPNTFSHRKLDIGTALFINHLADMAPGPIIDLGCGSGVLTMYASRAHEGPFTGIDVSHSAIQSSRATAIANNVHCVFKAQNGLADEPSASVSTIICNPPFHDGHAVGDEVALTMFADAHRCLIDGGELRIVGNRHLGYHKRLKQLFGNSTTLGQNSKFVVLSAIKRR